MSIARRNLTQPAAKFGRRAGDRIAFERHDDLLAAVRHTAAIALPLAISHEYDLTF